MSDVVERVESAIRMAIQAAVAAQMEDHPDSQVHLVRVFDEAPRIAQYVTTSRSWKEMLGSLAEVERLREAVTAADSILSLLHHRGLVDSENNRRDVAEVSEQLAALRRSGR